jgi:peptidoglycan/xylan/chitin deacetylase (PgdA/CDA1 family)
MRVVSPLLKHVIYPGLSWSGILRSRSTINPAVITYHGVLPEWYEPIDPYLDGNLVTAKQFRQQLTFLKRYYSVISPEEFLGWARGGATLPANAVLLTCDDGLQNNFTEMLPILQEFEMKCLFFVLGNSVGDSPRMLWHEELFLMILRDRRPVAGDSSEPRIDLTARKTKKQRSEWWRAVIGFSSTGEHESLVQNTRSRLGLPQDWNADCFVDPVLRSRFILMDVPQLKALLASGMTIGAHTMSHPVLSYASYQGAAAEISASKEGLQEALGTGIWALAYPFGDPHSVTHRELDLAEKSGFAAAFFNTTLEQYGIQSLYAFPRIHVTADMTMPEFEAHISGFHSALKSRIHGAGERN